MIHIYYEYYVFTAVCIRYLTLEKNKKKDQSDLVQIVSDRSQKVAFFGGRR